MDELKRQYIMANLKVMDPDYIVDVLGISSRELLNAFPDKLEEHLEEEYGDDDEYEDEESYDPFEEGYPD